MKKIILLLLITPGILLSSESREYCSFFRNHGQATAVISQLRDGVVRFCAGDYDENSKVGPYTIKVYFPEHPEKTKKPETQDSPTGQYEGRSYNCPEGNPVSVEKSEIEYPAVRIASLEKIKTDLCSDTLVLDAVRMVLRRDSDTYNFVRKNCR